MKTFATVVALLAAAGVAAVVLVGGNDPGVTMDSLQAYHNALADLDARGVAAPPEGSPGEAAALARFGTLFADLSPANVAANLDSVYAEDLFFNDTVKTIRRLPELKTYMTHTAEGVQSCKVKKLGVVRSGEDFFVRWEMEIVFKKLKPGVADRTIGMTHLRFDANGRVVLHQDFWDSARGIFQHVPVLGWAIRAIQARL